MLSQAPYFASLQERQAAGNHGGQRPGYIVAGPSANLAGIGRWGMGLLQKIRELRGRASGSSAPDSVPVIVDAIRVIEPTPMARATYFVVTSEVPEPSWVVRGGAASGAFLEVLGLTGVICRPGPPAHLFSEPQQISDLFESIESNRGLSVESEDLWLPAAWFPGAGEPRRGEVYRVDLGLFQLAYRFRAEEVSPRELLDIDLPKGAISFSSSETAAFQAWAEEQIDRSRALYPKDPGLELSYTEGDVPWEGQ